jgi:hypothetical protein
VISAYHKVEMHLEVNKASKEEEKSAAVYDYNLNTGEIDLTDQML